MDLVEAGGVDLVGAEEAGAVDTEVEVGEVGIEAGAVGIGVEMGAGGKT